MPPTHHVRNFAWDDLDAFTSLHNAVNGIAETGWAFGAGDMRLMLSQPGYEPAEDCFLAFSDSELAGYALLTSEPLIDRAVASGGVAEQHRNRGFGRLLLDAVSRRASASRLHVQVPAGSEPGRRLLEGAGFEAVRRYWSLEWDGSSLPPPRLPHGFSTRSFEPGKDEGLLADLQNAAFQGQWGFSPNTPDEIAAKMRLRWHSPEDVLLLLDGDAPVGYNWTARASSDSGFAGRIGMTGVHPSYRGRVMSLSAMQMSAAQLGTFLFGLLAESVGPQLAFGAMGAALMAVSAFFYLAFGPLRRLV